MPDRIYTMKGHEHIESEAPLIRAHEVARIYEAQERIVIKLKDDLLVLQAMYTKPLEEQIRESQDRADNAKEWLVACIKRIPDRNNIKHGRSTYGVKSGSFSVKIEDTDKAIKELKAAGTNGMKFLKTDRRWSIDKAALKNELQLEEGTLPNLEHSKLKESDETLTTRRRNQ